MSLAQYNEQLRHTTGSKIFWLKHIDPEEIGLVVDFGCADGHILKTIRPLLPEDTLLVGIDKDPKQIAAATQHFVDGDHFSTDWEYADHFLNDMPLGKKSILVLSSVIHEIGEEFPRWWKEEVESRRFDYVAIRDFARPVYHAPSLPLNAVQGLVRGGEAYAYLTTLYNVAVKQDTFGELRGHQLHALLKAVHWEDFERERKEDYFRWSAPELIRIVAPETLSVFRVETLADTTTPFFRKWCSDRSVFLAPRDTTHVEMLLVRR